MVLDTHAHAAANFEGDKEWKRGRRKPKHVVELSWGRGCLMAVVGIDTGSLLEARRYVSELEGQLWNEVVRILSSSLHHAKFLVLDIWFF